MSDSRKLKIALMSYAMDNRRTKGIALYTRKLILGLLENPIANYYLVHYEKVDDPLYKKAREILIREVRLPYGSHFISQMIFFWKYRKEPFDIIHWFHPRVYPFFWLVPAKKIIVTMHGAGDITAKTNFVFSRAIFNFVLRNFHKYIDVIVVDSNFAKDEVAEHYGIPKEKIKVIYLGGAEIYKPLNKTESQKIVLEKYGINKPYILDVSRLQPHKNVKTLIKSYTLLRENHPERKEKLVIVGASAYTEKNEDSSEYIEARKSRFSSDITFISFVDHSDLNAVYSASELFVFPSLNEGFGLPVLEAMASGVPVITSNVTSMPEIGGDAVITLDPLDVGKMAEVMHNTLTDEGLREKMIDLGLLRAKDFTWQKTAIQTEELYK